MKKLFAIFISLLALASCGTVSQINRENVSQINREDVSQEKEIAKEEKSEQKKLYKGDGIAIAITVPQIRNIKESDAWIPLYMQDSLTGNFAHYTKMTVLDRTNENLIKAEQKLSESAFYSDENAVQIGQIIPQASRRGSHITKSR